MIVCKWRSELSLVFVYTTFGNHTCVCLRSLSCGPGTCAPYVCVDVSMLVFVISVPREQLLQTEEYDLNVVRLCIQVFLQDENGHYTRPLNPIVTNPIYDNSELIPSHIRPLKATDKNIDCSVISWIQTA